MSDLICGVFVGAEPTFLGNKAGDLVESAVGILNIRRLFVDWLFGDSFPWCRKHSDKVLNVFAAAPPGGDDSGRKRGNDYLPSFS